MSEAGSIRSMAHILSAFDPATTIDCSLSSLLPSLPRPQSSLTPRRLASLSLLHSRLPVPGSAFCSILTSSSQRDADDEVAAALLDCPRRCHRLRYSNRIIGTGHGFAPGGVWAIHT